MATNKSMWVLLGILVIAVWIFGFAIQAGAETLKGRAVFTVTRDERIPVGFEEGHALGLQIWEGLGFFENGEIGKARSYGVWDGSPRGVQMIGYTIFTFDDGSTIVTRGQRIIGEGDSSRSTGEIIKGTGRFEGVKGTVSAIGKNFPRTSEMEADRTYADLTMTYTLPTK